MKLNLAPFLDPVGAILYRRSPVTTNNGECWVPEKQPPLPLTQSLVKYVFEQNAKLASY
jgi:hypothetical protein